MLKEMIEKVRTKHPLVHCMTNYVTANDCANLLLAAGASPIMADDPEEAEEIVSGCAGLVLNMGTPNRRKLNAMRLAGRKANELGIPVILDPVGVSASFMRLGEAGKLLKEIQFAVIRGNASEIRALLEGRGTGGGVDSEDRCADDHAALAKQLANAAGCTVVLTGEADIITDGIKAYRALNGEAMMRLVTGAGCQLSALMGAYAAANRGNVLHAALAAVCAMGICGEQARKRLSPPDGNATYRNYIIDAIYHLKPDELERQARYEKC